jgi:hypothetical protein
MQKAVFFSLAKVRKYLNKVLTLIKGSYIEFCNFFKHLLPKLPDFQFPARGIILFGLSGFKVVALSLIAILGIPIRLRPLWRVILYKVLFYVLPPYVFGAALRFLIRVLRVIGAGCFWLRVLGL